MMIDLGKAQILEWHVAYTLERGVYVYGALTNLLEQRAELLFVHRSFRISEGRLRPISKTERLPFLQTQSPGLARTQFEHILRYCMTAVGRTVGRLGRAGRGVG